MPYHPTVSRLRPIMCVIFLLVIFSAGTTYSEDMSRFYDLEIFVGDTTGSPGEQNSAISIYLNNFTDTVAGFNLWIQLSRPDIMEFQASLDIIEYDVYYIYTAWDSSNPPIPTDSVVASPTWVCTNGSFPTCIDSVTMLGYYNCIDDPPNPNCVDSVFIEWIEGVDPVYTEIAEAWVGNVDTVGTLSSGWEMITTRSLSGNGQDMLITAFADQVGPPPDIRTHGIGPQYSDTPLIRILGDIFPMDDTVTNRSATVMIKASIIDYFSFSDEEGTTIGVISEDVEYNTYYMCDQWLVPDVECMYWSKVMESECPQPAGCDWIKVDTILHGFLDVDRCYDPIGDSTITTVEEWECASQFDGNGTWLAGSIHIVYGSITVNVPAPYMCGDIDNSGAINIIDIVTLINFKYKGADPPLHIESADLNGCDGLINILDIVYLINVKYKAGPDPVCCGK